MTVELLVRRINIWIHLNLLNCLKFDHLTVFKRMTDV